MHRSERYTPFFLQISILTKHTRTGPGDGASIPVACSEARVYRGQPRAGRYCEGGVTPLTTKPLPTTHHLPPITTKLLLLVPLHTTYYLLTPSCFSHSTPPTTHHHKTPHFSLFRSSSSFLQVTPSSKVNHLSSLSPSSLYLCLLFTCSFLLFVSCVLSLFPSVEACLSFSLARCILLSLFLFPLSVWA